MRPIRLKSFSRCFIFFALILLGAQVHATNKARIAIIGDVDTVNVGQDGFCGERTSIPTKALKGIFVEGGQTVWFRIRSTIHLPTHQRTCDGEYSFSPEVATAYIVRYSNDGEVCRAEVFRVVPGGDPEREPIQSEPAQICMGK